METEKANQPEILVDLTKPLDKLDTNSDVPLNIQLMRIVDQHIARKKEYERITRNKQ